MNKLDINRFAAAFAAAIEADCARKGINVTVRCTATKKNDQRSNKHE